MAKNKEIVRDIYQAFSVGDIAAAFSHMDDDIEWTEAAGFPYSGTCCGHADIIEGVFKKPAAGRHTDMLLADEVMKTG